MDAYLIDGSIINGIGNTPECVAQALSTGISSIQASSYWNAEFKAIKASLVPNDAIPTLEDLDLSNFCSVQKQLVKLTAALLTDEIVAYQKQASPLFLAGPEQLVTSIDNMIDQNTLSVLGPQYGLEITQSESPYSHPGGRAGFFNALRAGIEKLHDNPDIVSVVVGGVDSPRDHAIIALLDFQGRLLAENKLTGFCPGEGGAFAVLAREPKPFKNSANVVKVSTPQFGEESGSFHSDKPCLGNGLCEAVRAVLNSKPSNTPIKAVYSSMNGEHYWSKELGTIMIRFSEYMNDNTKIEHPADCWGDIGAAFAPSVLNILPFAKKGSYLLCGSSESSLRAACLIEVK